MPFGGNDWLALTPEPTLEPEIPICDPHHHFWDFRPASIPYQRYLLHELAAEGGLREVERDHEAAAADVVDGAGLALDFAQARAQLLAAREHVRADVLALVEFEVLRAAHHVRQVAAKGRVNSARLVENILQDIIDARAAHEAADLALFPEDA